jgi:Carboxypeptidase regulatory-like domain
MGGTTRRKLIAAVAAALLAAGCSARSFDRVCGTVLDARTHQPIAQAKVTAMAPDTAQITATTDARGRFTFRHLSRRARLRVTSGNYLPAEVRPTGELLGVALAPIPVRGMVTSTLTGSGLRATVAGPNLTPTAADGSFQVYGLGPGDRLTVTAPGYKTAVATIGANRRVRVVLAPEEATRIRQVNDWLRAGDFVSLWRWVFRTPKGYGYVDLPADFKAEVRQHYVAAVGSTRRSVRGFEMRSVTEGEAGADIEVLAFAMDPELAAAPGFEKAFVAAFARNTGVSPRPLVLPGGARAAYFRPPEGAAALILSEGSLVVLLLGPPEQPIKRFATAFLAAHA